MMFYYNKLSRKLMASAVSVMLLIGNMQPAFALLDDREHGEQSAFFGALSEAAEESSLEILAEKGLIERNYLLKQEILDQAGEYESASFAAKLERLMAGVPGQGDDLFASIEGLSKIRNILLESSKEDNIFSVPADIGAVEYVESRLLAAMDESSLIKTRYDFLVEDITLIIEDLKLRNIVEVNPNAITKMMATWTKDNKVILRWQPEGTWIPADGYNLYRIIGKKASLLATGLGAEGSYETVTEKDEAFGDLLESAKFRRDKFKEFGLRNEDDLNRKLYTEDLKVQGMNIIRSHEYYEEYKHEELTLKVGDKYESEDLRKDAVLSGRSVKEKLAQSRLAEELNNSDSPEIPVAPEEEALEEIRMARSMVKAQANYDLEFAESTGMAFTDNLKGVVTSASEEVSYVLLPVAGRTKAYDLGTLGNRIYRYNREWGLVKDPSYRKDGSYNPKADENLIVAVADIGKEFLPEAPSALEGFGLNNQVSLRWDVPENPRQKGMISGYNVYRQEGKNPEFILLNESPVTVPFVTMQKGELSGTFESPIFYVDETAVNGGEYNYKVESVDIFGRKSGLSDAFLNVRVIKTELPFAPLVESPYLSLYSKGDDIPRWLEEAAKRIKEPSVLVPVSAVSMDGISSDDAVLFNIYRSSAFGKGDYDEPVKIATVNALNKVERTVDVIKRQKGERFLAQEKVPGIFYADSNISPGYNYRYWVSAVDSWNNESSWSMPVSIAYESDAAPGSVKSASAKLGKNPRPSATEYLPGFGEARIISADRDREFKRLISGAEASLELQPVGPLSGNMSLQTPSNLIGSLGLSGASGSGAQNYQTASNTNILNGNFNIGTDDASLIQSIKDFSDYGVSLTETTVREKDELPKILKNGYLNLPEPEQIQHILAYNNSDFQSDGRLELEWYEYTGQNLKCYVIYRGLVQNKSLDELNAMDKAAVLQSIGKYDLVAGEDKKITDTKYSDKPPALGSKDMYVYLIVAMPEDPEKIVAYSGVKDTDTDNAYGAWVRLNWGRPDNGEIVEHYRIYKAEVESLSGLNMTNYGSLNYTMLKDRIKYTFFADGVEQSISHSYVYKIVPVSLWGVEGTPVYIPIRVPSTIPPAEPEMLLPNSRPGSVEVRFTAVAGATKYNIYRTRVKKPSLEELQELGVANNTVNSTLGEVSDVLSPGRVFYNLVQGPVFQNPPATTFNMPGFQLMASLPLGNNRNQFDVPPAFFDDYRREMLGPLGQNTMDNFRRKMDGSSNVLTMTKLPATANAANLDKGSLLKYASVYDALELTQDVSQMSLGLKRDIVGQVIKDYGILSVLRYNELNPELAATIDWIKVGTLEATSSMAPGEALEYTDNTAIFGEQYLYTVSASNEDLESTRPEPIEATCLKGEPFPEPPNLKVAGEYIRNENNHMVWVNRLSWDPVSYRHFSQEELERDWIAGYIVYRSNKAEGPYHQISGIISKTAFDDATASPYQPYYYRVKTVDTAGFITRFDSPGGKYAPPEQEALKIVRNVEGIQAPGVKIEGVEKANIKGIDNIRNTLNESRYDDLYDGNFYDFVSYLKTSNATSITFDAPYPNKYVIEDINLNELALDKNVDHEDFYLALFGHGNLTLGPTKTKIPVNFVIRNLIYQNRGTGNHPYWIYDAEIRLDSSWYLQPDTGIKFDFVNIDVLCNRQIVGDGLPGHSHMETVIKLYPQVSGSYSFDGNFAGDTDVMVFSNAHLSHEGIITIDRPPVLRWNNLMFYNMENIKLDINSMNKNSNVNTMASGFPITLNNGLAESSMNSATIDNQGLLFDFTSIGLIPGRGNTVFCPNRREFQKQAIGNLLPGVNVDLNGNLSGIYGTLTGQSNSYIQLAAPIGLSVQMTTGKLVLGGQDTIQSAGKLNGKVILPFFEAPADLADGVDLPRKSTAGQAAGNDLLLSLFQGTGQDADVVLNTTILNLFDEAIKGKMVVMDGRTYGLSKIPFALSSWGGDEILLNEKHLNPVLVGNYDIRGAVADLGGAENQTIDGKRLYDVQELTLLVEQSFVVRSGNIGVDLSETKRLPDLPTDKWYSRDDWKGIILNEGSISLSRSILVAKEKEVGEGNASITFSLAPREMIYDRNGFYYYNKIDAEGDPIPVSFGEHFGGFEDATLSYCEVEMYANQFDLWIAGTVKVPALGNHSLDYIMEKDEEGGAIRAYIMPKQLKLAEPRSWGTGRTIDPVVLNVYGGFFNRKGANIEGTLSLNFPGQLEENLNFCELVIPYVVQEMNVKREDLAAGEFLKKGTAQFETPYRTTFNGYPTELRAIDLYAKYDEKTQKHIMGLYLSGSSSLAGNMEMPVNNNARYYIDDINGDAEIDLDECIVDVVIPFGGGGGLMAGQVKPAGDKQREEKQLSKLAGKDSETYKALKEAQEANKEALEMAGKANEIKDKIDKLIAKINKSLSDMDGFNDEIEAEIKAQLIASVDKTKSQRLAAKAMILNNTRFGIDLANTGIDEVNKNINDLNVYINEYADIKPERRAEFEKGIIPKAYRMDKKSIMDQVDSFTTSILDNDEINQLTAAVIAQINGFKLDLFKGADLSEYQIPITTDDLYITAVLGPASEVLAESQKRLDEVMEYYDQANGYIDQLDKYIDGKAYPAFTIGENGIVEFNPSNDAFCATLLKETNLLEGTDVHVEGRMGWYEKSKNTTSAEIDPDLFFYAFAVAYLPKAGEEGKTKGISMGSMELHNLVGMTAYNFIPPYSQGSGYTIGTGMAMLASIANLQIDMQNKGDHFFAVSADMYINSSMAKHQFAIKDMMLFVDSKGSFQISGRMFGPSEITMLSKSGPNNSTTLYGSARLTYNAVHEAFEFRGTLNDFKLAWGFKLAGTLGFDWGPDYWMLYLGYPETLKLTYEPWGLTGGFGLSLGVNPVTKNGVIKVKLDMSYKDEFDIGIVYAGVSAYAMVLIGYGPWNMLDGEDELRWFNGGMAFEGFAAGGRLGGQVVGGIKLPGNRKFDIIRLSVDSQLFVVNPREDYTYLKDETGYYYYILTVDDNGNPVSDKGKWYLDARLTIAYHLDLWLVTFSDSFSYHYKTSFGMS